MAGVLIVFTGLAVLAGAVAQRVSGMGFALLASPVLVLLLGPFDGVLLVNICGAISAALVITQVWRRVHWRQYLLITPPALLAIIPGALVAVRFEGPALQITVGLILVFALTISLLLRWAGQVTPRSATGLIAGGASGFMNATAGIGGPAISVHAVLTRWDQQAFAATLQPYFVTTGVVAFSIKAFTAEGGLPDYDWSLWVVIVACTIVGLLLGGRLARLISTPVAQLSVIVLSYATATVAIVDGIAQLGT